MRELIKHFVNICAKSLPIIEPIYEFGSHQVPGQEGFADLRPIFPDMEYVGSDMREGVGVDRVLNLHHIDLPDESVGTVLCLDTLEHVEYPRRAMEEIRRILKPDGLVVISSVMNFPIHDYPNDYWRFTPEAFNILLQDFNRHYSDFAGDEQFPHTVIGVAFKGDIPEEILEIFQQEIKVWKELCRGEDEGPENQVSGADKDLPSPPSPSPSPSPAQHFEPPSSKRYEPASLINLEDKNDSHSLIVELAGTNNTILEVGTSTGYLTRILKVRGNRVIGIEVDGEAAKIAEEHCDLMITGNVEEIDLDDYLAPGSIDVAVFGDVLEHLRYPAAVLKRVRRYLKPHGSVVVSIPNVCHGDVLINLLNGDFRYTSMGLLDETHLRFFGLKNVLDLLADSGYSIEEVRTTRHPVGGTELRRSPEEVPAEIRRLIEALPNSDVYQFVLLARPSDDPKSPPVPTADLKGIFDRSVEPLLREREEPLRREVAEAMAKSQEASERIRVLDVAVSEREGRIAELSLELAEARERAKSLGQAVEERDGRITDLLGEVEDSMEWVKSLDQVVSEREGRIAELDENLRHSESHAQQLENEITEMRRSIVWQFVMKYHCEFVDRFLPLNSGRRKVYDLGIKGGRILVNEGSKSLYLNYKRYRGNNSINQNDYKSWITKNEPNDTELKMQKRISHAFEYRPLISIVTPIYNPPVEVFKDAVDSVLKQTYSGWELCLVDGGSDSDIRDMMRRLSKKDSRIKFKILDQNLGISGNTNEALKLATGEFIALLDHDDLLAPFALFEVVKSLNDNPDLDFIYSDKDLITADGIKRYQPLFKPDWSPEMMLSANYITHFCIIRKCFIDRLGGFLPETDGAQDWDLFLRVTEATDKIYHIPKILYHWRSLDTSCAKKGADAKPYIFDAQRTALKHHLQRKGLNAELVFKPPGLWRVKWSVSNRTNVSIVIVSKDIRSLRDCIDSIISKTSYKIFEIIIVYTDIKDYENSIFNELTDRPQIKILKYLGPLNKSKMFNFGVSYATGDAILFLSDDLRVITNDWLEEMVGWIEQDEIGVVGPKLINQNSTIERAGATIGLSGFVGYPFSGAHENHMGPFGYSEWYRNYLAVSGACMMIRLDKFQKIGGFDESINSYSDIDFCLRVWEIGYRIVYTPFAKLLCVRTKMGNNSAASNDIHILSKRYKHFIDYGDPYYNLNLSLCSDIPMIKSHEEKNKEGFQR